VLPALAVADVLRARGVEVTFAGSPDRVEAQLVPDAGYEIDFFRISGLPRRPSPALVRATLLAGRAPRACAKILALRRPDVVLGGGGYVSGPMVYAAWRRRIPAALTEADAHLGLANRLAARFAQRVFLAYEIAGRLPPKYRVVGRPINERSRAWPRAEARAKFGLPAEGSLLLVAGARAGARALNELAVDAFGANGPAVLHIAGERDYDALRERVRRNDYVLVPVVDEFGAALGAADLAISRAGGTVWELAAAGLPAILVPYPYATGDHQTLNARHFERGGGALLVPETRVAEVPEVARSLLADADRLAQMRERMLALARPDAAKVIAEELRALAS
jgi:UDP-N-acetylglucosamine--N-acetylmuramyl-(pentapeptide) pyrophosphoryl-undecaprenol N-acetylglucosamine transferase